MVITKMSKHFGWIMEFCTKIEDKYPYRPPVFECKECSGFLHKDISEMRNHLYVVHNKSELTNHPEKEALSTKFDFVRGHFHDDGICKKCGANVNGYEVYLLKNHWEINHGSNSSIYTKVKQTLCGKYILIRYMIKGNKATCVYCKTEIDMADLKSNIVQKVNELYDHMKIHISLSSNIKEETLLSELEQERRVVEQAENNRIEMVKNRKIGQKANVKYAQIFPRLKKYKIKLIQEGMGGCIVCNKQVKYIDDVHLIRNRWKLYHGPKRHTYAEAEKIIECDILNNYSIKSTKIMCTECDKELYFMNLQHWNINCKRVLCRLVEHCRMQHNPLSSNINEETLLSELEQKRRIAEQVESNKKKMIKSGMTGQKVNVKNAEILSLLKKYDIRLIEEGRGECIICNKTVKYNDGVHLIQNHWELCHGPEYHTYAEAMRIPTGCKVMNNYSMKGTKVTCTKCDMEMNLVDWKINCEKNLCDLVQHMKKQHKTYFITKGQEKKIKRELKEQRKRQQATKKHKKEQKTECVQIQEERALDNLSSNINEETLLSELEQERRVAEQVESNRIEILKSGMTRPKPNVKNAEILPLLQKYKIKLIEGKCIICNQTIKYIDGVHLIQNHWELYHGPEYHTYAEATGILSGRNMLNNYSIKGTKVTCTECNMEMNLVDWKINCEKNLCELVRHWGKQDNSHDNVKKQKDQIKRQRKQIKRELEEQRKKQEATKEDKKEQKTECVQIQEERVLDDFSSNINEETLLSESKQERRVVEQVENNRIEMVKSGMTRQKANVKNAEILPLLQKYKMNRIVGKCIICNQTVKYIDDVHLIRNHWELYHGPEYHVYAEAMGILSGRNMLNNYSLKGIKVTCTECDMEMNLVDWKTNCEKNLCDLAQHWREQHKTRSSAKIIQEKIKRQLEEQRKRQEATKEDKKKQKTKCIQIQEKRAFNKYSYDASKKKIRIKVQLEEQERDKERQKSKRKERKNKKLNVFRFRKTAFSMISKMNFPPVHQSWKKLSVISEKVERDKSIESQYQFKFELEKDRGQKKERRRKKKKTTKKTTKKMMLCV